MSQHSFSKVTCYILLSLSVTGCGPFPFMWWGEERQQAATEIQAFARKVKAKKELETKRREEPPGKRFTDNLPRRRSVKDPQGKIEGVLRGGVHQKGLEELRKHFKINYLERPKRALEDIISKVEAVLRRPGSIDKRLEGMWSEAKLHESIGGKGSKED